MKVQEPQLCSSSPSGRQSLTQLQRALFGNTFPEAWQRKKPLGRAVVMPVVRDVLGVVASGFTRWWQSSVFEMTRSSTAM